MRREPASGAESKLAYWPGKSRENPSPREDNWDSPPPTPGTAEMDGGVAPAGLRKVWVRPFAPYLPPPALLLLRRAIFSASLCSPG
jgi:hypothetical protein